VLALTAEIPEEQWSQARQSTGALVNVGVAVSVHRGKLDEAAQIMATFSDLETSADEQERGAYASGKSRLLLGQGNAEEALRVAEAAFAGHDAMGMTAEQIKEAFVTAVEAAFALGDDRKVEGLLATVEALPPGGLPQFLRAHASRFRARLGSDRVEDLFKGAAGLFRELAVPFYLAVTELEHAEWLLEQGRAEEAEPLLAEAREIFERLDARPWLERAAGVAVAA
jgi:hypothetical protein